MYNYRMHNINETCMLQKDAHGFADHLACPEMIIRVDFEG